MREIEFTMLTSAGTTSRDRYRLSPREASALRQAPILGIRQAERRRTARGANGANSGWTMWLVSDPREGRDEDLTNVVEGLLRRGFLTLNVEAGPPGGPPWADLTPEGRVALDALPPETASRDRDHPARRDLE